MTEDLEIYGRLTVAVLTDLSELLTINDEGLVASLGELLGVSVVDLERDGLSSEPVADVIRIAVEQVDTQALVEQELEILAEVGEDEVASVLELPADS